MFKLSVSADCTYLNSFKIVKCKYFKKSTCVIFGNPPAGDPPVCEYDNGYGGCMCEAAEKAVKNADETIKESDKTI